MKELIAIRLEDKSQWERRAPLTPPMVKRLVEEDGIGVLVQRSPRRIFDESEYLQSGAKVSDDISSAPIIFGVKEVPKELLLRDKVYIYFSHVIKGQDYNMAMLARLLELGCTLIDYECVADDAGNRLIFFGRYAGLAGMIDSLATLGRRLQWEGISNPFSKVKQAHTYESLDGAVQDVRAAGEQVASVGLPPDFAPLIVGVAGYGNVAGGVQEILDALPTLDITPDQVAAVAADPGASRNHVYRVTYREKDLVEPVSPAGEFELQDYYQHPEKYRSRFTPHLDHLSVLMNCIYWDSRYPRLVTYDDIDRLYLGGAQPRLRVLGDISCDIEGSIQCTVKATEPGEPVYVFDPQRREAVFGVSGQGPVMMAVDILPSELPREASGEFSKVLGPLVPAIARADYAVPYEQLDLPSEIKRAVIVHRGEFSPDYAYLQEHLKANKD